MDLLGGKTQNKKIIQPPGQKNLKKGTCFPGMKYLTNARFVLWSEMTDFRLGYRPAFFKAAANKTSWVYKMNGYTGIKK
jgi:hypothetical protein